MPKIDLDSIPQTNVTSMPPVYAGVVEQRLYRRIGPPSGLTDFGISHVVLKPGAWSSQRHWHEQVDEFAVILSGEAVLIDDNGRTPVKAGDCLAFPKDDGNGHHLINESDQDCVMIAVGCDVPANCHYPDVDMMFDGSLMKQCHKDGSPY